MGSGKLFFNLLCFPHNMNMQLLILMVISFWEFFWPHPPLEARLRV